MNHKLLISLGLAASALSSHIVHATDTSGEISIANSSDRGFMAVPIQISRETITGTGVNAESANGLTFKIGDKVIPSQLDDLDGDGRWDEAALVIDITENTELTLRVMAAPDSAEASAHKTNIRIGQFKSTTEKGTPKALTRLSRTSKGLAADYSRQYQMEGPAWENDVIGFRMYFDERNGFDIFGKTTIDMVLDGVGISENYHQRQSWGMDILKVGRSLGAGALAFASTDKDPVVQRLTNAETTTATIMAEGPVRSVLDIHYTNIPVANAMVDVTQRITIWAGQHSYHSSLTIDGLPDNMKPAVGLVNFFNLTAQQQTTESHVVLSTYGVQAEEKTNLGMAIVTSPDGFHSSGSIGKTETGIEHSEYVALNLDSNNMASFEFYAVWEPGSAEFKSNDDLIDHVSTEQTRKQSVSVKPM